MRFLQTIADLWHGKKPTLEEKASAVVEIEETERRTETPTETAMLWWCLMPSVRDYDTRKVCIALANGTGGSECFISARDHNHGWVHFPSGFDVSSTRPEYKALDAARQRIQWGMAQHCFINTTDPVKAEREYRDRIENKPLSSGFRKPNQTLIG